MNQQDFKRADGDRLFEEDPALAQARVLISQVLAQIGMTIRWERDFHRCHEQGILASLRANAGNSKTRRTRSYSAL